MIGIDLGIKNLGLLEEGKEPELLSVDSFKDIRDFGEYLNFRVRNQIIYVDFNWNEIYLPGKRRTQAEKYYLFGCLDMGAYLCFPVEPKRIREFLNLPPKTTKKEVHRVAKGLYTIPTNPHLIDAFLLLEYGKHEYNR